MSRVVIAINASAPNFLGEAIVEDKIDKDVPFCPLDKGYKILFFYKGNFISSCADVINGFAKEKENFERVNCKIYGASVDGIDSHLAWCQMSREGGGIKGVNFTLFSDVSRRISSIYSALSPEGPPHSCTFIINEKGKIKWYSFGDVNVKREMDNLFKIIYDLQGE